LLYFPGVIKVSNNKRDLQGYSRSLVLVPFDWPLRFPARFPLVLCLDFSFTASQISSVISNSLRGHVTLSTFSSAVKYQACTSTRQYQSASEVTSVTHFKNVK